MTALREYHRLETLGLWRERASDQRREVIVCLGDATLVMSTAAGDALGHWSLPAIERLNPGRLPALFAPALDSREELELADPEMIDAIERIRRAVARTRPRPGRLRQVLTAGSVVAGLVLAVVWLPGALTRQTAALLPQAKRVEIGEALLGEMIALAGRPCGAAGGREALAQMALRIHGEAAAPHVVLFPALIPETISLPGNIVVGSAALAEDHETPEVMAGYLLAESVSRAGQDPVELFLSEAGLGVTFRLLTTGEVAPAAIRAHAARLLSRETPQVPDAGLLERFAAAGISSQPYAYARDISGESVVGLIEADPLRGGVPRPVLADGDWVSLQEICSG